ncbi:MAG: VWA domain-containing protein [Ignavibacteriota bacterium]|nr:VWA domain-containing protein [Ignavibacterium album]MCZ2269319.1 VWA domain-containing protein [Ignavibacteriales bacterium]QKJ98795.1 MAG: VWA domain-containing protein [Ignavibacteriota bacterium]HMN17145.1 VWA domain-containing protein [Ignavibacteriaceae bacterium]HOJ08466.1 VWA domain-containing protein [Ignavibacteriaceae bacterium]
MKSLFVLLIFLITFTGNQANSIPIYNEKNNSSIQLAILLDTSSSMDGLIDQAKSQLWKIVNELAVSKKNGKSIELFVALYEYGNDGLSPQEGYIRKITPFTQDLDKISDELFKLKTNGGQEYCGQVIQDAISNLQWNKSNDELKIIFIAGNEPFTQGEVNYKDVCKKAIKKGIVVNTIHCGDYDEGIRTMWKDAADISDGKYMNIDHNADIVHIDAPQDTEIIKLGQELNKTYLAFGYNGTEKKALQQEQDANSINLSNEVMVQRSVTKSGSQYKNTGWDLVDAQKDGSVKLDELKDEELPDEMKKMSISERKAYIDKMSKEREKIQTKINKLNEERSKYISQKMLDNKNTNTLDAVMIKTIREQAKQKNYSFSK